MSALLVREGSFLADLHKSCTPLEKCVPLLDIRRLRKRGWITQVEKGEGITTQQASDIKGVPSELILGVVDLDFECSTVHVTFRGDEGMPGHPA